jgi:hypothetical protein
MKYSVFPGANSVSLPTRKSHFFNFQRRFTASIVLRILLLPLLAWGCVQAQPLMPKEVGQQVNGFQDAFEGAERNPLWVPRSNPNVPVQDVYVQENGVLKVSRAAGPEANHLLYEAPGYDPSAQEVLVRMRITRFDSVVGGSGRSGIATSVDPEDSHGINVFFSIHPIGGRPAVRHLDIRDDGRRWGGTHEIHWEKNAWYWLRLRHDPAEISGEPDIFVKVWRADGNTPEPEDWHMLSDNYPGRDVREGFAGITAGIDNDPSEFEVDYFLLIADGLPLITVSPPANTPPEIIDLTPAHEEMFVSPATQVRFTVNSDAGVSQQQVRLTLNGQDHSSQLQFSGTEQSWDVELAGNLAVNRFYTGVIEAADVSGRQSEFHFEFNTLHEGLIFIESEDFNFDRGDFIDDPMPASESLGAMPNNYWDRWGWQDIDYNEINDPGEFRYRNDFLVGILRSADVLRPKFLEARAQLGVDDVFDYNLGWITVGEWHNYTRTFPPGEYHVYGRMAQSAVPFAAQLDRVVSDRSEPDQETEKLGIFRRTTTTGGNQQYVLIPLTDDDGSQVTVSMDGVETIRVTATEMTATGTGAGGTAYSANYLLFVPADSVDAATMTAVFQDGQVILTWDGPGTLQSADEVTGTWSNVPGNPSSPHSVNPEENQRFFRIRQ